MKRIVLIVVTFGGVIGLWALAVASGKWSPVLLPSPASVAEYLWSGILDGSLLDAAAVTMQRHEQKQAGNRLSHPRMASGFG